MAELRAPAGQFLLLEMEPGLHPAHIGVLCKMFVSMAQVRSVCDLSLVPLPFLEERILMRLAPEEVPREFRTHPGARRRKQARLLD